MHTIISRCAKGHEQRILVQGDTRLWVERLAAIMDGSINPEVMARVKDMDDDIIGNANRCQVPQCRAWLSCEVVDGDQRITGERNAVIEVGPYGSKVSL